MGEWSFLRPCLHPRDSRRKTGMLRVMHSLRCRLTGEPNFAPFQRYRPFSVVAMVAPAPGSRNLLHFQRCRPSSAVAMDAPAARKVKFGLQPTALTSSRLASNRGHTSLPTWSHDSPSGGIWIDLIRLNLASYSYYSYRLYTAPWILRHRM